tara:strand:+ start:431 stop:658 length:228 start_codon:yes stop_codon:yes gene_type:complete
MGIGPNNIGPDGKEGYTSCGHPTKSPFNKMDEGLYKLADEGEAPLNNLGFIKAKTLAKNPNATTMKVGDEEMPIK